ncbi:MAG: VWA domain-containing protein [Chloroflexota bacterium]
MLHTRKTRQKQKYHRSTYYLLTLIIIIMTTACAPVGSPQGGSASTSSGDSYSEPSIVTESETGASDDGASPADSSGPTIVTGGDRDESAESISPAPRPTSRPAERPQQSADLKAGEVDDNEDWADYLDYRRNYRGPRVHDRDISERYIIEAIDKNGHPVLNANVRIYLDNQGQSEEIYEGYTYADGRALFHPKTLGHSARYGDQFLAIVKKNNAIAKVKMKRSYQQGHNSEQVWTVKLDITQQVSSVNLDVLFLLDATGSMGDEIHAIQSTIFDVAERIDNLPERPNVRYGLVTYRDRGDAYISKTYGFENNVAQFSRNLDTVYANGGGDYPESLNEGLHKALHNVTWRSDDTVRLIFLVADAPPHLDYRNDYDYAIEMETAARSAIKVFPIASSGLDEQGEYIFRQIAQFTQGRFIFLTYDGPSNGGKSGDVTTHNVDSYSVSSLDSLLVDLVTYELSHQNPLLSWRQ